MKQAIILTRLNDDNDRFIKSVMNQYQSMRTASDFARLKSILFDSVIAAPMLERKDAAFSAGELLQKCAAADIILISSRHAVSSLCGVSLSDKRVAVVGAQTAAIFTEMLGRAPDFCAPTMQVLLDSSFIKGCFPCNLLYIRGVDVAYDVSAWAQVHENSYAEVIVYNCAPVTTFLPFFEESALGYDEVLVTFFSRRTAQNFINIASHSNLLRRIKRIKALCISDGVLESLDKELSQQAYVAATPDLQGMAALVLEHFHAN